MMSKLESAPELGIFVSESLQPTCTSVSQYTCHEIPSGGVDACGVLGVWMVERILVEPRDWKLSKARTALY